jgi:hypothetical protein
MRKIAHIINPVIVEKSSDLYVAQPITFETMKIAKKNAAGQIEVDLFTAQYPEDRVLIPDEFQATADLERSVLDLGSFQKKRKLPLLADILDRLYEASDAEYFIFTNVDIAVLPHFYITVEAFIAANLDAFAINRRTISAEYHKLSEIPLMYAEMGKKHEGHDCFVFRRDVYPKYHLGAVCIGIPWVGRVLLWNLVCHAKNFQEFKKTHLTFHLGPGNDGAWQGQELSDYRAHNISEAQKVIAAMQRAYGPFDGYSPFALYPPLFVEAP